MRKLQFFDQGFEAVAVFSEVNGIRRGPEDGNSSLFQSGCKFQRCLTAKLHDHAFDLAVGALSSDDLDDIFGGQGLKIQPVRGVVVGRHRFRIAIDHDGFITGFGQRKAGMAAAIIEFDALPNAVGAAAKNDDLFFGGGLGFANRFIEQPGFIGRIHVRGRGRKFGRAGIDALVDRRDVEAAAMLDGIGLAHFRELGEARV